MREYNLTDRVEACKARLNRVHSARISGTVTNLLGLVVEVVCRVAFLAGDRPAGDGHRLAPTVVPPLPAADAILHRIDRKP